MHIKYNILTHNVILSCVWLIPLLPLKVSHALIHECGIAEYTCHVRWLLFKSVYQYLYGWRALGLCVPSAVDRYYEAICSLPKLESGSFEQYLQDTVQTCLTPGEKAKDEVRVHHWRLIYFCEEQKGWKAWVVCAACVHWALKIFID